jgi:hypothetical protein
LKLISDFNSVNQVPDALFFIEETYVNGQQKDAWCRSKTPITDMKMHYGGSQLKQGGEPFTKSSSCYLGYYSGSVLNYYGLILFGDTCVLSTNSNKKIYFICE